VFKISLVINNTIEDIFGLPHLGDAAMPAVKSFGPDVFG